MPDDAEDCVRGGGSPGNDDSVADGVDELDDVDDAEGLWQRCRKC